MLQVADAKRKIHEFLEDYGWVTNITKANYVKKGHRLEFKVGTSYGEVAVHVRDVREVLETIRILNEDQLAAALERLSELMHESEVEAVFSEEVV